MIQDGRFTIAEIAEVGGLSPRMISYVIAGEKDIAMVPAEKISRFLCDNGEKRPSEQLFCPRYIVAERASGTANGCVKDELVSIVRATADADSAHGKRDRESMDTAIAGFKAALADLEAEAAAL